VSDLVATIDASVLLSLQSAELPGAVSVLFNRLLVPVSVRKELTDGGEKSAEALKAIDEFAIFERCDEYDRASVGFCCKHAGIYGKGKTRAKRKR
jgi:hypothetical protein